MESHESKRLQKEILYWKNLISSHKQHVTARRRTTNAHNKPANKFTWKKDHNEIAKSPSLKSLTQSQSLQSSSKTMAHNSVVKEVPHLHQSSPQTSSSCVVSTTRTRGENTTSNNTKYKWKNTYAADKKLQVMNPSTSGIKSTVADVKDSALPSGQSSESTTRSVNEQNNNISQLTRAASAPNLQNSSKYKWSKNDSMNHTVSHNLTKGLKPEPRSAKLPARCISMNTKHQYRKNSVSSRSPKSAQMRKCILSKYKLLRTSQKRSLVNVSNNPFKVIKKRQHTPKKKYQVSNSMKSRRFSPTNFAKFTHNRYRYSSQRQTTSHFHGRYQPAKSQNTNNRFKFVRQRVQTRSLRSGNIVLKRKQKSGKTPAVLNKSNNQFSTAKLRLASQALYRSLATVRVKNRHKLKKVHCIFYNRFGKCNRGEKCPYIHDPDRIAMCTQFLRGTCRDEKCPFSHKASKHKMPVCSFFLRGKCSVKNCPYLHVFVGHDAKVCKNFAQHAYCHKADECKDLHIRACPEFYEKGTCQRGRKCSLPHRRKTYGKRKRQANDGQCSAISPNDGDPRKLVKLDDAALLAGKDFIELPKTSNPPQAPAIATSDTRETSNMRIQPRLKLKKTSK